MTDDIRILRQSYATNSSHRNILYITNMYICIHVYRKAYVLSSRIYYTYICNEIFNTDYMQIFLKLSVEISPFDSYKIQYLYSSTNYTYMTKRNKTLYLDSNWSCLH